MVQVVQALTSTPARTAKERLHQEAIGRDTEESLVVLVDLAADRRTPTVSELGSRPDMPAWDRLAMGQVMQQ